MFLTTVNILAQGRNMRKKDIHSITTKCLLAVVKIGISKLETGFLCFVSTGGIFFNVCVLSAMRISHLAWLDGCQKVWIQCSLAVYEGSHTVRKSEDRTGFSWVFTHQ